MTRSTKKKDAKEKHVIDKTPPLVNSASCEEITRDKLESSSLTYDQISSIIREEVSKVRFFFKEELERHLGPLQDELNKLRKDYSELKNEFETVKDKNLLFETQISEIAQYNRRNNIEIAGISDDVHDDDLEDAVINICNFLDLDVSSNDIEACHRLPKSKNSRLPKRSIIRFVNRKKAEELKSLSYNLKNIKFDSLGFKHDHIYINENLCKTYRDIWYKCRKLHKSGKLYKYGISNGFVTIKLNAGSQWMKVKHSAILFRLFPEFSFFEDVKAA